VNHPDLLIIARPVVWEGRGPGVTRGPSPILGVSVPAEQHRAGRGAAASGDDGYACVGHLAPGRLTA